MDALVAGFFVERKESVNGVEHTLYDLNHEPFTPLSEQEGARFLVAMLRHWRGKAQLFCNDKTTGMRRVGDITKEIVLREDEWKYGFKKDTDCDGCRRCHTIMERIFGSLLTFTRQPYVMYHEKRQYTVSFQHLRVYAEQGEEGLRQLLARQATK
jgi:hypothetical protein